MDVIQDYPSSYNRSLRLQRQVQERELLESCCRKAIEPVDVIKKRHENVRTQFGKYLKKRKGTSGAGTTNIILIDQKFERLMWLKNFIVTRPNSGNFRRRQMITKSNMELAESDDDEDNSNDSNVDSEDKNEIISNESICSQANPGEEDAEECKSESQQQRNKKPESKKESRTIQLEKTDKQLNQALASLNSTLSKPQQEKINSDVHQLGEDELYALSLGRRFQKLDSKQKALMRNGIERLFLELEVGSRGFAPSPHQSFFQSSCHVSSVPE